MGSTAALTPELFAQADRLRWVQAPVAGVEHYVFPALAESDVVFTNMAGIYSDVIADHALTYLLMFARGFHRLPDGTGATGLGQGCLGASFGGLHSGRGGARRDWRGDRQTGQGS